MDSQDKITAVALIRLLLPTLREILSDIRSANGYFNLPWQVHHFLTGFESASWAQVYESERSLRAAFVVAFFEPADIAELAQIVRESAPEEVAAIRSQLGAEFLASIESGEDPFGFDQLKTLTQEESDAQWAAYTDEERTEVLTRATLFWYFLLPNIFNSLAVMSFGRSMFDLVSLAKQGDDTAFCNAVQVDRTVLFGIPYFRQRLIRAQVGPDVIFLTRFGEAIKGRVLRKKLSYPELMLVFSILDGEGLLDMPLNELLNICEELGVYGREHGVEDTESLRKRRQYFRKMTGRQI